MSAAEPELDPSDAPSAAELTALEATIVAATQKADDVPVDLSEKRENKSMAEFMSNLASMPNAGEGVVAEADQDDYDPAESTQNTQLPYLLGGAEEAAVFDEMMAQAAGTPMAAADSFWALACLRARKYDTNRALALLETYLQWRQEFKVDELGHGSHPRVQAWGKLQQVRVAGNRDLAGRWLLTVTLRNSRPAEMSPEEVMRGIHCLLENLLRKHPEAQARGISLIMDLRGVQFANLDSRVCPLSA